MFPFALSESRCSCNETTLGRPLEQFLNVRPGKHLLAWAGCDELAIIHTNQMRNALWEIFTTGCNEQNSQRAEHQTIEDRPKIFPSVGVQAIKGFVQYQQAQRQTKCSGQLNSLRLSI